MARAIKIAPDEEHEKDDFDSRIDSLSKKKTGGTWLKRTWRVFRIFWDFQDSQAATRDVQLVEHMISRFTYYAEVHSKQDKSLWINVEILYRLHLEFEGAKDGDLAKDLLMEFEKLVSQDLGEHYKSASLDSKDLDLKMPHTDIARDMREQFIEHWCPHDKKCSFNREELIALVPAWNHDSDMHYLQQCFRILSYHQHGTWKGNAQSDSNRVYAKLPPDNHDEFVRLLKEALGHRKADWYRQSALLRYFYLRNMAPLLDKNDWWELDSLIKRITTIAEKKDAEMKMKSTPSRESLAKTNIFEWTELYTYLKPLRETDETSKMKDRLDVVQFKSLPTFIRGMVRVKAEYSAQLEQARYMKQKMLAGVISLVILMGRLSTDALKKDKSTSLMRKMVEYSAKGVNETFTAEDASLLPPQLAGMGKAALFVIAGVMGSIFLGMLATLYALSNRQSA